MISLSLPLLWLVHYPITLFSELQSYTSLPFCLPFHRLSPHMYLSLFTHVCFIYICVLLLVCLSSIPAYSHIPILHH